MSFPESIFASSTAAMSKPVKTIPLKITRELAICEKTGELIVVTHRRRGLAMDIHTVPVNRRVHNPIFMVDGDKAIAHLTERLRKFLTAEGLPTDQEEIDWQGELSYDPAHDGEIAIEDVWFEVSEELTEPHSKGHAASVLLHALAAVTRKFDSDQKRLIVRLMFAYFNYRLSLGLNESAVVGQEWKERSAKGPQAKHERARSENLQILEIAEKYWQADPALRNRLTLTAKKIAPEFNELRRMRLPHCEELPFKTIENKLRAAMKGSF